MFRKKRPQKEKTNLLFCTNRVRDFARTRRGATSNGTAIIEAGKSRQKFRSCSSAKAETRGRSLVVIQPISLCTTSQEEPVLVPIQLKTTSGIMMPQNMGRRHSQPLHEFLMWKASGECVQTVRDSRVAFGAQKSNTESSTRATGAPGKAEEGHSDWRQFQGRAPNQKSRPTLAKSMNDVRMATSHATADGFLIQGSSTTTRAAMEKKAFNLSAVALQIAQPRPTRRSSLAYGEPVSIVDAIETSLGLDSQKDLQEPTPMAASLTTCSPVSETILSPLNVVVDAASPPNIALLLQDPPRLRLLLQQVDLSRFGFARPKSKRASRAGMGQHLGLGAKRHRLGMSDQLVPTSSPDLFGRVECVSPMDATLSRRASSKPNVRIASPLLSDASWPSSPLLPSKGPSTPRMPYKGRFGSNPVCGACKTSQTPYWRDSWSDAFILCNACGLRYSKFKRYCNACSYVPRKEDKGFSSCTQCSSPWSFKA